MCGKNFRFIGTLKSIELPDLDRGFVYACACKCVHVTQDSFETKSGGKGQNGIFSF